MNIHRKPQAAMPSSFNTEVLPFRLLRLLHSLATVLNLHVIMMKQEFKSMTSIANVFNYYANYCYGIEISGWTHTCRALAVDISDFIRQITQVTYGKGP